MLLGAVRPQRWAMRFTASLPSRRVRESAKALMAVSSAADVEVHGEVAGRWVGKVPCRSDQRARDVHGERDGVDDGHVEPRLC